MNKQLFMHIRRIVRVRKSELNRLALEIFITVSSTHEIAPRQTSIHHTSTSHRRTPIITLITDHHPADHFRSFDRVPFERDASFPRSTMLLVRGFDDFTVCPALRFSTAVRMLTPTAASLPSLAVSPLIDAPTPVRDGAVNGRDPPREVVLSS